MRYNTGLLIGRFQPFHFGHLYLIKKALEEVEKLIIGIGSANIKNRDNPLSFEQRKKLLDAVFKKENLVKKISKIAPINDYSDDNIWLEKTLDVIGAIDVIIGNNEWVNSIFEAKNYPILRIGLYKRYLYESQKIRELIRAGHKWSNRIPSYLVKAIKKSDFT